MILDVWLDHAQNTDAKQSADPANPVIHQDLP